MDIKDLQNLIKFVSKADVAGVKYKTKDFEINITNHTFGTVVTTPQMTQVQPVVNAAPVAQPEQESSANSAESAENGKYITINRVIYDGSTKNNGWSYSTGDASSTKIFTIFPLTSDSI